MSAIIFNAIEKLKADMKATQDELAQMRTELAQAKATAEALAEERRSILLRMAKMEGKMETLFALRKSIEADARDILGATRERIDPTKVKMPEILRHISGIPKEAKP